MKYETGKQKLAWFSPAQLEQLDFFKKRFPNKSQGQIIRDAMQVYFEQVVEQDRGSR